MNQLAASRQVPGVMDSQDLEPGSGWMALLQHLQTAYGCDLRGYKPTSLSRRVRKRMGALGLDSFARYHHHLQAHPGEFTDLLNTILINVTGFFRDPAVWDAVRRVAIPHIVRAKAGAEPIRIWTAGCASGEEAYTVAMLLSEELGEDQFRARVRIFATDLDEEALNDARRGVFTDRQLEGVPPALVAKYFEQTERSHMFRQEVRRRVTFGRHDLISDIPISRIDLLTCRNTLMYLEAKTQARVLDRLQFAVAEGGFLLLGRADPLAAESQSFHPVDFKGRLSRKVTNGALRRRVGPVVLSGRGG